jgi:hypothetical protein
MAPWSPPADPTDALVKQALEVAARVYWRRFGGPIEVVRAMLPDVLAELVVDVVEGPAYGEGYAATPDERAVIVRALEALG